MTGSLRRYARSFTGFERDARIFLLATLVYGVMLSLWWVDFNLYLTALGFDTAFIGIVGTASAAAAAVAAFPASMLSDRIGRRLVLILATGVSAAGIVGLLLVLCDAPFFSESLLGRGEECVPLAVAFELQLEVGDQVALRAVAQPLLNLAQHRRVDVLVVPRNATNIEDDRERLNVLGQGVPGVHQRTPHWSCKNRLTA